MTRVVFLHVHKTGGSALLAALRGQIGTAFVDCSYLARAIDDGRDVYRSSVLRSAQVLAGHHLHQYLFASAGVHEPVFVDTVLRAPWDRAVSLCSQQTRMTAGPLAKHPMTLEQYSELSDPVCHMILRRFPGWDPGQGSAYQRARAVLGRFSYVGAFANDGVAFEPVWSQLGLEPPSVPLVNVSPRASEGTDPPRELVTRFEGNHAGDISLYRDAVDGRLGTGKAVELCAAPLPLAMRSRCRAFTLALAGRAAYQTGRLPSDARFAGRTLTWMVRNAW